MEGKQIPVLCSQERKRGCLNGEDIIFECFKIKFTLVTSILFKLASYHKQEVNIRMCSFSCSCYSAVSCEISLWLVGVCLEGTIPPGMTLGCSVRSSGQEKESPYWCLITSLVPSSVSSPPAGAAELVLGLRARSPWKGLACGWCEVWNAHPTHPSPSPIWNTLMVPPLQLYSLLSGPCSYPWINRAQVAQSICFRTPKEKGHLWKQATVPTTHARSN